MEVVYVAIGNPDFCLALYSTDAHFRGKLHHAGDFSNKKTKCRPISTRKIGRVRLSDELYPYRKLALCSLF